MSGEQQDIEGLPVDYARPPEAEEPATRSSVPDRLAVIVGEYNDAQRSGIIEGVLWACRRFAMFPGMADEIAEVEAALRKRFGSEHVDREKKLHEGP
jgi:hypothetical protein